jgi:uncharacterized membrane protein
MDQVEKLAAEVESLVETSQTAEPFFIQQTDVVHDEHHATPPPLPKVLPAHLMPVVPYQSPTASAKPAARRSGLEQTIGLKWAGWVGALVLVIGAGLGIKFAYDQGWFLAVPPAARLGFMCLAGLGLIGAGEWIYRRINTLSAAGFYGAGVAVLFLVSYSGHAYYDLYQRNTAFVFMGISTLVGAAVARRGNLVSIAVLALIGGNLAPALLHQGDPNVAGFLSYLLMLQGTSLLLAAWGGGRKWWTLRGLSLGTTSLWTAALIANSLGENSGAMLLFVLLFAALYQTELVFSTARARSKAILPGPVFSTLVTTALTIAVLYLFRNSPPPVRATWVLAFAAITVATGVISKLMLRSLAAERLATGYVIQSAALITLAVPVAFGGVWVAAGWGILGITFSMLGWWLDIPVAVVAGPVVWLLAVTDLFLWTSEVPLAEHHRSVIWFTLLGVNIRAYACLGWLLPVMGHIIARPIGRAERYETAQLKAILSALSGILWVVVSVTALPPIAATVSILIYAWLLAIGDLFLPDRYELAVSLTALLLATLKWTVIDTLSARLAPGWTPGNAPLLFTPELGLGAAIAVSILGIYYLRRSRLPKFISQTTDHSGAVRLNVTLLVALLVCFGFSFEIDRIVEQSIMRGAVLAWPAVQMKLLAWGTLWACVAGAFTALIQFLEPELPRRNRWYSAASAVTVLLAAKYCLVDGLYFTISAPHNLTTPLFNLQLLAGVVTAGSLLLVHFLSRRSASALDDDRASSRVWFAAGLVLVWAGTMEIDRAVERFVAPGSFGLGPLQWKNLLWTSWWMIGIGSYLLAMRVGRPRDRWDKLVSIYWLLPAIFAVKFLLVDTLYFRVFDGVGSAPVIANPRTATAAVVFGGMVLLMTARTARHIRVIAIGLAALVALWAGSFEIDQLFNDLMASGSLSHPGFAEHMTLSVFWSIFALGAVSIGFKWKTAGLRYFGLTLFAITLMKVVIIDLNELGKGYRILSFLGLGILLMGTSVLYGKLTPKLLGGKALGGGQAGGGA